ncbi:potassium uptake protein, integral membrane comp onent, KtrB [Formosa agariphila KMM 3901]|uniref:Potassium uptake protein, integral membrane comp onent, KtrB n=1 Tax=Formosa agariphila (strain DSM 15362 / KCTC 12365 / LMG 23005 / KMM 3901 / M-2Alg 35-1) TaxID=1347342 RepID=T2KQM3_FORAG|nr:potassium transporter TrkG [Formosa agariphila]CDF81137.1 potassium uptake protein, integral membrane comp onent, KtrB [Formosa agariphila KMM 3901]
MKLKTLQNLYRFTDILILFFLIFDFGFTLEDEYKPLRVPVYTSILLLLITFNTFKFFQYSKSDPIRKTVKFNIGILVTTLVAASTAYYLNQHLPPIEQLMRPKVIFELGLFFYLLMRLTFLIKYIYKIYFNPAILFAGSFFLLILMGALLLMLPKVTVNGISFLDALFTATSAICVTGLAVLDTGKDFTQLGQTLIVILIQIGGLGILTFTSFFAYFFKENSSFRESMYLKDYTSTENLQDVFKIGAQIVGITLGIELIGAILIYTSIDSITTIENKVFFSIFHSISAFCNAGFSTSSSSFYEPSLRYDYSLQWVLMLLIIIGGIGYSFIFNSYSYLKRSFLNLFRTKNKVSRTVRVFTLNSKITIVTTSVLLIFGFIFFYFAETNFSLQDHDSVFGKITTAMFSSVTPRTAGFNTVDYGQIATPSLLIVIFLMWIGASPGSTGGGIKTSTFAIASLNIFATARGKKRIEINTREISSSTVNRAFSIIFISLMTIGTAILLLLFFEPEKDLLAIAFECFSAYSTSGLSMNLTPTLSDPSKYVIIAVMFVGRIGLLNLLFGMLGQVEQKFYQYPQENILIN